MLDIAVHYLYNGNRDTLSFFNEQIMVY